jgi:aerotaxis receptor
MELVVPWAALVQLVAPHALEGKTMSDIVSEVKRVSDLIAEISSATQEQESGISQIGQAIGGLDEITQQNAALVEQSAAASDSLKLQAERLVEAVSVFR